MMWWDDGGMDGGMAAAATCRHCRRRRRQWQLHGMGSVADTISIAPMQAHITQQSPVQITVLPHIYRWGG